LHKQLVMKQFIVHYILLLSVFTQFIGAQEISDAKFGKGMINFIAKDSSLVSNLHLVFKPDIRVNGSTMGRIIIPLRIIF